MLTVSLVACLYLLSVIVFSLCDFNTKDSDEFSAMSFYTNRHLFLPESYYRREAELYLLKKSRSPGWRNTMSNPVSRIDDEYS